MASFIRGTTPTFTITSNTNLNTLGTVKIRLKGSYGRIVDITPTISTDGLTATFTLTQEQSLKFKEGSVQVQLVAVKKNISNVVETVFKSDIATITVNPTIIEEAQ